MNLIRMIVIAAATAGCAKFVLADEPEAGMQASMQVTTTKTVEHFVPAQNTRISALELRSEATVTGANVTLKQVCRWPDADADAFAEVADLVVLRLGEGKAFDTLTMDGLQSTLRDAGVNPAVVNFAGAAICTVSRSDVKLSEGDAINAWAASTEVALKVIGQPSADEKTQQKASKPEIAQPPSTPRNTGDLRAQLIDDVAAKLNLPADTLQVDFRAEDAKLLGLTAPFAFAIEPQRYGDLGDTSWAVTVTANGKSQRIRITATARAWTEQIVLTKPLTLRQTIAQTDFEVKRILADHLPRDPLAVKNSTIGQQASRDLRAGTVLTEKMIAAVEYAHSGQLVTVHMRRGNVDVKSVATALQNGSAGQSIKVKNDVSKEVFQVTLTGPQTAVLGASDPVASAD